MILSVEKVLCRYVKLKRLLYGGEVLEKVCYEDAE